MKPTLTKPDLTTMTRDQVNELYPKRNGFYFGKYEGVEFKYPSITAILNCINKPYLITWAAKQCAEIALENPQLTVDEVYTLHRNRDVIAAGTRGKGVHNFATEVFKNINSDYLPAYEGYIEPLKQFMKEMKPELIWNEKTLISHEYGIGGTADWLLVINKKVCLLDIKTSKDIYPSVGLQLGFYRKAFEEMGGNVDDMYALHLPGNFTYSLKQVKGDMNIVLAMKMVYNWSNNKE